MPPFRKIIEVLSLGTAVFARRAYADSERVVRFDRPREGASDKEHSPSGTDVLFVGFVGGTGGISVLMLELAEHLASCGVRVKILVPAWETTLIYAERCRQRGIEVERTPLLLQQSSRIGQIAAAIRLVRRYRAPIVHYHVNEDTLHHSFLYAMELLHAPAAYITVHGTYDHSLPDDSARRWAAKVPRIFSKVICISRRGLRRQLDYGVPLRNLKLIYNGIDVERFGSGDGGPVRRQLGVAAADRLILFSSRLEAQKRPLDAVRAFRKIANEFPDVRLVFVGDGSLATETKAEVEKLALGRRVHFVGQQFNVADWLSAATVWLLPTETEGFSLAVIEAMAAGCPIVSTVCPGNDEVLVDGENSLLTAVGDVDAQAACLRRLLSNAELRDKLGANARSTAKHYSLDRMLEEHIVCYAGTEQVNSVEHCSDTNGRPALLPDSKA